MDDRELVKEFMSAEDLETYDSFVAADNPALEQYINSIVAIAQTKKDKSIEEKYKGMGEGDFGRKMVESLKKYREGRKESGPKLHESIANNAAGAGIDLPGAQNMSSMPNLPPRHPFRMPGEDDAMPGNNVPTAINATTPPDPNRWEAASQEDLAIVNAPDTPTLDPFAGQVTSSGMQNQLAAANAPTHFNMEEEANQLPMLTGDMSSLTDIQELPRIPVPREQEATSPRAAGGQRTFSDSRTQKSTPADDAYSQLSSAYDAKATKIKDATDAYTSSLAASEKIRQDELDKASQMYDDARQEKIDPRGGVSGLSYWAALFASVVGNVAAHGMGVEPDSLKLLEGRIDKLVNLKKEEMERRIQGKDFIAKTMIEKAMLTAATDKERFDVMRLATLAEGTNQIEKFKSKVTNKESAERLAQTAQQLTNQAKQLTHNMANDSATLKIHAYNAETKRMKYTAERAEANKPIIVTPDNSTKDQLAGAIGMVEMFAPFKSAIDRMYDSAVAKGRTGDVFDMESILSLGARFIPKWIASTDANELQNIGIQTAKILGASVEKGRLTNEDFEFWKSIMPSPGYTPASMKTMAAAFEVTVLSPVLARMEIEKISSGGQFSPKLEKLLGELRQQRDTAIAIVSKATGGRAKIPTSFNNYDTNKPGIEYEVSEDNKKWYNNMVDAGMITGGTKFD